MRSCIALIRYPSLSLRLIPALLTAWLLVAASAAFAAPGDLDPAFGTGGKVTTDFDGFDNASALVVQPDGKLVAAGGLGRLRTSSL